MTEPPDLRDHTYSGRTDRRPETMRLPVAPLPQSREARKLTPRTW
jgi:hypothetical protein